MAEALYRKVAVIAVKEERADFKTIVLQSDPPIIYKAGQYLTLVQQLFGEEVRRSYSITSSPVLDEPLTIGVKRIDNGLFSRMLADYTAPGDVLTTTGAGGFFTLPETEAPQLLFFFAAGSGITPVYSLIKTALHQHKEWQLVLVYSNASRDKTIFYEELLALQTAFAERFRCVFLFSDHPDGTKARLNRDLLLGYLSELGSHKKDALFYVCGPESYNRMVTYVLQEQGISSSHIRKENFWIPKPASGFSLPPDKATHTALIHFGDEYFEVPVHFPDSILRAAKLQQKVLPYSCDAGRCGNCVARCISGTVWHSYNEVLTEKDLAEGLVLTCTGHPVGGDVELLIG